MKKTTVKPASIDPAPDQDVEEKPKIRRNRTRGGGGKRVYMPGFSSVFSGRAKPMTAKRRAKWKIRNKKERDAENRDSVINHSWADRYFWMRKKTKADKLGADWRHEHTTSRQMRFSKSKEA